MGYKTRYDDARCVLYISFDEDIAPEDLCEINEMYETKLADKMKKIIVDISKTKMSTWATPWDRKTRQKVTASVPPNPPKSKVAIMELTSIFQMLPKVSLSGIGRIKYSKFFKSEAQALTWLKGEVKR